MGNSVPVDPPAEPLLDYDEEIDQQVAWEEELEKKYGAENEGDDFDGRKMAGTGFAKQKQVMEQNRFYQNKKRPKK